MVLLKYSVLRIQIAQCQRKPNTSAVLRRSNNTQIQITLNVLNFHGTHLQVALKLKFLHSAFLCNRSLFSIKTYEEFGYKMKNHVFFML